MTLPSAFRHHSASSNPRESTSERYLSGSHREYKGGYTPSLYSDTSNYNHATSSLRGSNLMGMSNSSEKVFPLRLNSKSYKSSRDITTVPSPPRNRSSKYESYKTIGNYRYDQDGDFSVRNRTNGTPGSASSTSSGSECASVRGSNLPSGRRRPLPRGPGPLLSSQDVAYRRKGSDSSSTFRTTSRGPLRADHQVASLESHGRYGSRNKIRQSDLGISERPKAVRKRSQSLDNVHRDSICIESKDISSSSRAYTETPKRHSFDLITRTPSLGRIRITETKDQVESAARRLQRLTMLSHDPMNRSISPTLSAIDGLSNGKPYANGNKTGKESPISSPTMASPTLIRDSPSKIDTYLLSEESVSLNCFSPRGQSSNGVNGMVGFKNLGNTCFMNSIVQCLRNLKKLCEIFISNDYRHDLNDTSSVTKGKIAKSFADVVRDSWDKTNIPFSIISLAPLKAELQQYAPRFCGYDQQDSQEFLRFLLEGLHDDLNVVKEKPKNSFNDNCDITDGKQAWKQYEQMEKSSITSLFVGQLKSSLTCSVCNFTSVAFDPFWDLSLPMPKNERNDEIFLKDCFDIFTKEETLDGEEQPSCEKCQTRRKCTKKFSIERFPQILVIHLKRFSGLNNRAKLSTLIDLPFSLSLSTYSSIPGIDVNYSLVAISNHMGTTYSGHYTAYCKHPESGNWYSYNDCRVAKMSEKDVVSSSAYVIFYELNVTKSSL